MTPEQLETVGEALYGPLWRAELSRVLGISERTLRRWILAKYPIPEGVRLELIILCEEQGSKLLTLAKALRANAPAIPGG